MPGTIDLGDWSAIEPLFAELEKRAPAYTTAAELERWLLDQSELTSALDEEQARRYIAKSCHTDNADAEKAFLDFIENVKPQIKPWQFKLDQLYLQHPVRAQLPRDRYEVFDRTKQVEVELFRAENVPLETEDTKLGNEYQKLTGGLTVQFRGEEKTLVAMGRYQEEPCERKRGGRWSIGGFRNASGSSPCSTAWSTCASAWRPTRVLAVMWTTPSESWGALIILRTIASDSTIPSRRRSCRFCANCSRSAAPN